jgi:hypothetical protein
MEDLLLFVAKAYMYIFVCRKLVVEALGHTSESPSCVFKLQTNGLTCHPFIGG